MVVLLGAVATLSSLYLPIASSRGRRRGRQRNALSKSVFILDYSWPLGKFLVAVLGAIAASTLGLLHVSWLVWLLVAVGVILVIVLVRLAPATRPMREALAHMAEYLGREDHAAPQVPRPEPRREDPSAARPARKRATHTHVGPGTLGLGMPSPVMALGDQIAVVALSAPEAVISALDAVLTVARDRTISVREQEGGEAVCEIIEVGAAARIVALDRGSRATFVALLRERPGSREIRFGEALAPDDGASLLAIVATAFSRLRPLNEV